MGANDACYDGGDSSQPESSSRCEGCIAQLVGAGQGNGDVPQSTEGSLEPQQSLAVAGAEVFVQREDPNPTGLKHSSEGPPQRGLGRPQHGPAARSPCAYLLGGNLLEGATQDLLVVESDRGEYTQAGPEGCGGIALPADARFRHDQVDLARDRKH